MVVHMSKIAAVAPPCRVLNLFEWVGITVSRVVTVGRGVNEAAVTANERRMRVSWHA